MTRQALSIARSELVLGGQKSGKSRRAEALARTWLDRSPAHRAVLIATGQAWDAEMRERIARHQRERAERVPGMATVEEPRDVAGALARCSTPQTLVVVDCLTLWLTQWLMPLEDKGMEQKGLHAAGFIEQSAMFLVAIRQAPGPVVVVGNEIGLGVIPMGREVRAFVDALGVLNQRTAEACERVTLVAAGLPLTLKEPAP
ncbi:bifunctional adenosylcobinamide kinase/adenosylcobinamide-phosphate guanylyltransferase [Acidovorax sp. NCPPB 4044]|uniref:bifunctional adenosylcobinamide kinase/adenosylcobinamide-phosphate guanylyltransferase n=1 Tax=Acidovorax sp. NCPPB 4044 TaxID=2940490 RepID=UPI002303736D|nr:bifunctional adenosylcobinamide kinase/adenosylcobinamide-phosphate guanylyltransferase [Acidovorax sp. NCPPB 4044]MDA8520076.1 bifunctional adenosylcobinamide kinase/adenosylcobinamide-phosphate guanylyltransferase [Acidovorax sp. NCPPB 4044]